MRALLLICSFLITTFLSAGNVHYVKENGVGNGTSWAQASGDIQAVINFALPGDEIHIAGGVFRPKYIVAGSYDLRDKSFVMKDGVKLIGGFNGVDENEVSQPHKYSTTLSGDIGVLSDKTDNCYHVVYISSSGTNEVFHLEGVSIVDGYADVPTYNTTADGAAIYINVGLLATVTIMNCKMSNNMVQGSGGAIQCKSAVTSDIRIHNNLIHDNWAVKGMGGGINIERPSNVTIQGNTIVRNSALQGAALAIPSVSGTVCVINNIMWDNVTAGSDFYSKMPNDLDIRNNILTVKQEDMELDESNIIGEYPNFVNPSLKNFGLLKGSLAINKGNDLFVPIDVKVDLNGKKRINETVDIGAYEYIASTDENGGGSGGGDGDDSDLLEDIIINGEPHDIRQIYDLKCEDINTLNVELIIVELATVISQDVQIEDLMFEVVTDRPMYKEVKFTITSEDGLKVKEYVLKIERRIPFEDVIKTKWDNTFAFDLIKLRGIDFSPKAYQWFMNEVPLKGEINSYLAAGPDVTNYLQEGAFFHAALVLENGTTIHTCSKQFFRTRPAAFGVYPNPVQLGQALYLQADSKAYPSDGSRIEIYDTSGSRLNSVAAQPDITELPTIKMAGTYIIKFVGKDGNNKTSKIIVK